MSSLLEKLKAGKRNVRIIRFPGTEQKAALRALSNADLQEAAFATENHFKSKNIEITTTTIEAYEDENTTQILFRALRNPDDPDQPFAKSVDELRSLLTRDEKDYLAEQLPKNCQMQRWTIFLRALKKTGAWEKFKFRYAEKAYHVFGIPATDLTEGQWLYILSMTMPEKNQKPTL